MHINKIFTHVDLDGATSAIVALCLNKNARVFSLGNSEADEGVLSNIEPGDCIVVVDLPLKEDTVFAAVDLLGADSVLYTDHHIQSMEFPETYPLCFADKNECGASLLYKTIKDYEKDEVRYAAIEDLVTYTRDYDLWIHQFDISKELDALLKFIGFEKFIDRFTESGSTEFTSEERFVLDCLADNKENRLEKAKTNFARCKLPGIEAQGAYTFETGHINDLLNLILTENEDIDYAMSINMTFGTVSIRSRKGSTFAHDIAVAHGGGGHAVASGFKFDVGSLADIIITKLFN